MFEQLKELLVNELSVNADDITMDAELVSDLGFPRACGFRSPL